MPPELLTLLRRDHAELQAALALLLDPDASPQALRTALDGLRLGLTAHADAEAIVLAPLEWVPGLERLVAESRAAHQAQASALATLGTKRLATAAWRDRAQRLRDLVRHHAHHEEHALIPALAARPEYPPLAAAFATERLCRLAMLQPSGPVLLSDIDAAT